MQKEKLELVILVVTTSVLILFTMIAVIMLFRIFLKRKNRLILEKERMSVQFEQTLLRSKLEIQEQTFTDISREIHDNIGQVLSLVRINLNTLDPTPDPSKHTLMDDLLGKAITDLRNLSHSLDTDLIRNIGWIKATERLLIDLQKSANYEINFTTEENLPAIGTEKPIILFRMIQEIINNIIKHAKATTISFRIFHYNNGIQIEISDNGRGFNKEHVTHGAGLQNLSSRSAMINAILDIRSEPGHGSQFGIFINTETNE